MTEAPVGNRRFSLAKASRESTIPLDKETLLKTVFNNHTITTKTNKSISTTHYKILDTIGKNCITFQYYTDTDNTEGIYIDGLDKCELNTGTELLTKIEEFARLANIKHIYLEDESIVRPCDGIDIKLYYLNILCTGQSWYNKHGYKSKYHRDELEHNRKFIYSSMNNYINDEEDYLTLSNILNPDAEEPDVKGTVQDVFKQLKHYLLSIDDCSDNTIENIEFIRDLVDVIGKNHIKYNRELLGKEITSIANGGTKRKRNKSKKSRRRKSKK